MPKIKITVVKRFHPKDVFGKDYVTPAGKTATECQSFKDDQEFIVEKGKMPDGFCTWAWYDLYKDLSVSTGVAISATGWKTVLCTPLVLTACARYASS
jgi:uncharacterized repeat protein (TIGR04076 family)